MAVQQKTSLADDVIIRFEHVQKSFGSQVVCRDINLDIEREGIISFLGPSGCGKTVTIKMIIGLLMPDSGSIFFEGQNVAQLTEEKDFLPIRQRVAMVFQGAALFDSLNVFENVAFALREQGKLNEVEIAERVQEKLAWVGLPDAAEKMPGELSGGMKKRVGLARAIASEPEVILYDEPTAGLDPINTRRIVELIMNLQSKLSCTSVVVTHDIPAARIMSTKVALFQGGYVRKVGTFSELENSSDNLVRGFISGNLDLLREDGKTFYA